MSGYLKLEETAGWSSCETSECSRYGERRAIIDNGVGCFILNQGSDPTKWEYLKLLALTLDEMEIRFEQTVRPFIYTVSREGKMNQVLY